MEKYIPDMYQKSIYAVDYKKIYNRGIRCLLFDLDNTLVPLRTKQPSDKLKQFINTLKEQGFKIIIFSSKSKKRLAIFKEELNVDVCSCSKRNLSKKIQYILDEYSYNQTEVAMLGDLMVTDIAAGNKMGITTILINPISKKDSFFIVPKRLKEKKIMTKLRNNNLFVKGRYYE